MLIASAYWPYPEAPRARTRNRVSAPVKTTPAMLLKN